MHLRILSFALLTVVFALPAGTLRAQEPDPASWAESLKKKGAIKGSFPYKIAIVEKLPKKGSPEYVQIDSKAFDELSFMVLPNILNAQWNFKLNKDKYSEKDPFETVMSLTDADTVIETGKGQKGRWTFYKKGRKKVHAARPPKSTDPAAVSDWLLETLGWDGVVLDQRGDYLLVGSTTKILAQPEIQALAIEKSEDKFVVSKAQRKGSGLLSLSKISGGFGVFDIVFLGQGVKSVPPGTKLIIEKKK